jgi:replicative DNA helicase
MTQIIKDGKADKSIPTEMLASVIDKFKELSSFDLSGAEHVVEKVELFARHQAISNAILKSVDYLDTGKIGRAEEELTRAFQVGATTAGEGMDFFADAARRKEVRKELAAGTASYNSIPTGLKALDSVLYQKGWGRGELSVMMGKPKVGKSTSLLYFGRNAALAGYNVLLVSLEVSSAIIADRLDASITSTAMSELAAKSEDVAEKIETLAAKAGKFIIEEFPTGTFSPGDLRRLLKKYRAKGQTFDMIVVDYADIMAPTVYTTDPIENSKSIYVELRAISQEENAAMLSATQTNREGAKASVSTMEHVAEDFNRVRIADVLISINSDEAEKKAREARLYFAASRNQKGDFTIRIKQDLERMNFIERILGIE